MTQPERLRYIVSRGRLSYKRHGRTGHAWFVVDTDRGVVAARADDRETAQVEADRLNTTTAATATDRLREALSRVDAETPAGAE